MSALRKRINYLEAEINVQQNILRTNGLALKNKLSSPPFILASLIGTVGLGYYLMRHQDPKILKAKMAAAPGFFMKIFKHAELLLPLIL